MQHDGNGWVHCQQGHRHWGRHGAAGLLLVDHQTDAGPMVLLQHRAIWTASGDTWGVPGGARDSHESPEQAAVRETWEETGVPAEAVRAFDELVDDHGGWSYITVVADLVTHVTLVPQDESQELRWVPAPTVETMALHPGFARTWPRLRLRMRSSSRSSLRSERRPAL